MRLNGMHRECRGWLGTSAELGRIRTLSDPLCDFPVALGPVTASFHCRIVLGMAPSPPSDGHVFEELGCSEALNLFCARSTKRWLGFSQVYDSPGRRLRAWRAVGWFCRCPARLEHRPQRSVDASEGRRAFTNARLAAFPDRRPDCHSRSAVERIGDGSSDGYETRERRDGQRRPNSEESRVVHNGQPLGGEQSPMEIAVGISGAPLDPSAAVPSRCPCSRPRHSRGQGLTSAFQRGLLRLCTLKDGTNSHRIEGIRRL
jgi:hypothetical protein